MSPPNPSQKVTNFSLVAAVVTFGVHVYFVHQRGLRMGLTAIITVGVGCVLLALTGLAAGVFAVWLMRQNKQYDILRLAIGACILNGLALAHLAYTAHVVWEVEGRPPPDAATTRLLVGSWEYRKDDKVTRLDLGEDGSFHYRFSGDSGPNFSGTWTVTGGYLYLTVETIVAGNRDIISNESPMKWSVEAVNADELVVGTSRGPGRFIRTR